MHIYIYRVNYNRYHDSPYSEYFFFLVYNVIIYFMIYKNVFFGYLFISIIILAQQTKYLFDNTHKYILNLYFFLKI